MRILKLDACPRTGFGFFPSPCTRGEGRVRGLFVSRFVVPYIAVSLLAGCADNPQSRQQLDAGEQALTARQYDQAIRSADAALSAGGSDDAEANYLRGRAIEERPKPDAAAAARDLAMAQAAYLSGLTQHPSVPLSGLLHGQLGNIAYYRDDFATALREFSAAEAQLDQPQWKAWVLYRMGICQQCLSRFEDADRTFQQVREDYPGTEPAARAAARQGIRGFYVQIGAYGRFADIQKAAAAVTAVGSVPLKTTNRNLTVIRTADMPSYAQAQQLRAQLAGEYPDAMVMP
jgi:tetratricopeptide (TPR) repeat protein